MSVFHNLKSAVLPIPFRRVDESDGDSLVAAPAPQSQPERETTPWKAVALQAAGIWLASRVAIVIYTYFAVILNAQGTNAPPNLHPLGPSRLLDAWNQWDVGWYKDIAVNGYHSFHTTAFFPFFPLLTHLLTVVVGTSHVYGVAMIVSNAGTLVAFIAIGWLAAFEFGPGISSYAVRAAAAYPFMFFAFAGYSDSWFLAWCALSLLFARRGMWPWCAACAFMASLTRPTALVLIVPLIWEYGRQLRAQGMWSPKLLTRRAVAEGIAVAGAIPLGFAVFGLFLWNKFHNPLEWVKAQQAWDHYTVAPWDWAHMALDKLRYTPAYTFPQARLVMDLGAVILVAILTLWGARRLPSALTIYMLAVIGLLVTAAVPGDFDPFNAESRYLIMSVPIFLLLGRWMSRRPWLDMFVVGGGFLLQGVFAAYWLRHGWIV
jgi:hypothetical protein